MASFVDGYNHEYRHSGIGLNTPADVHYGLAEAKAIERAATLDPARARFPRAVQHQPSTKDPVHSRDGMDQQTSRQTHRE